METSKLTASILALAIIIISCHSHRRKTIIATSSDSASQKVEYTGWINFSADKTAILSMSPNSYLEYEYNDEEIKVKSDSKSNITYVENDGTKTTQLNNDRKRLLAGAIKFITKQQHLQKNNGSY